jgi:heme O synthase-like polyprenyltransferase
MKVLTPYNTHVGAISGSMPTLLGFSAALGTGILTSPWCGHAVWLFAMQTLWQMPHFYALAWIHRADYIKGGYSMFPLSDATGHKTAAMSKPYLVAMCAMPWVASAAGLASWMLPVGAAVPSYLWWHSLRKFEQKPNAASCRRFFLGSLSYLMATLALFTAYARAEQTEDVILEDTAEETSDSALQAHPLEPAWRARLSTWFSEFCPHEQVRHFLLGALNSSCPFSAPTKL